MILAFFGSRPMMAIDDTDLPDPDSPTTPSTSPARQIEGDVADGVHHAVVGREIDAEVLDASRAIVAGIRRAGW